MTGEFFYQTEQFKLFSSFRIPKLALSFVSFRKCKCLLQILTTQLKGYTNFLIDFEVEQAIYRVKEVVLYCSVCSSQETYFQSDAYLCFILLVRGQEPQFKLFG